MQDQLTLDYKWGKYSWSLEFLKVSFLDKFENSSISKMFSGSGGFPGMSLLTGGGGSKTSPAPVGS